MRIDQRETRCCFSCWGQGGNVDDKGVLGDRKGEGGFDVTVIWVCMQNSAMWWNH